MAGKNPGNKEPRPAAIFHKADVDPQLAASSTQSRQLSDDGGVARVTNSGKRPLPRRWLDWAEDEGKKLRRIKRAS
jgi:hypothetical protein